MSDSESDREPEVSDDEEDAFMFHGSAFDDDEEEEEEEGEQAVSDDDAPPQPSGADLAEPTRSGFSKISGVIMDKKLSGGVGPVLAMKQSAVQKITQREAERKEQAIVSKAKQALNTQNSIEEYDSSTLNLEKTLIKIATKGVVKLFTAVVQQNADAAQSLPHSKARRGLPGVDDSDDDQPSGGAVDKSKMQAMVQQKRAAMQSNEEGAAKKAKGGAAWMSDNFATQNPKAWDQESDSE